MTEISFNQPLVSIITPLHNEELHLAESIESILRQSYVNWEYIVIDNNSTDRSPEICARYAARDQRIRVYRNPTTLSPIVNHNVGLRYISATSKYCKVVFADDWIFPECIERMVAVAEANPTVGIVSAYTLEGRRVTLTGLPYHTSVINGRYICRSHLLDALYVFGSANSVLYRADLVRQRHWFFNEANIHADTEVCFDLLQSSDFGFVHQVLTFTRVRSNSLNSRSTDLHSNLTAMLHILMSYGKVYLSEREWEECLRTHLAAYYRFLGKSLLLGRERAFWATHKRGIREVGLPFSVPRVIRAAAAELADCILNPKLTAERFLASRQRQRSAAR